jgi:hypothetical protein
MELSPSGEPTSRSGTQHFNEPEGSLLCSQQPAPGPNLSQMNPAHTTPSYVSKIWVFRYGMYVIT